jgi:hypothetical protein
LSKHLVSSGKENQSRWPANAKDRRIGRGSVIVAGS